MREWKGFQIGVFLAVGSLIIGLTALQSILPVWQTLTDSNARTLFWRANVPSWEAFEFANAKLDGSHDKILLIGESRGLWLEIPFIAPTAFNGPQMDQVFAGDVSRQVDPAIAGDRHHPSLDFISPVATVSEGLQLLQTTNRIRCVAEKFAPSLRRQARHHPRLTVAVGSCPISNI